MHHRPRHRRHLIESLEPRQLLSTVTVASATASESAGSLTFHVSLDAPSTHDVTLRYVTARGAHAATPNKDYVPARGQLTLPAGQTKADITVTLKDDSLYEPTETLRLNLSARGAKLAKSSATGTITDDDLAPTVTVDDVTTKESNAGQHTVTLTVSLSKPAGSPLTFKYATSDDTPHFLAATAGSDYAAAKGTLTFRPGQTKQTIKVAVKGDRAAESDEAFLVSLTYLDNPAATATVTIQNDDQAATSAAPVLTLADATVAENDPGASPSLTVTLSRPATKPVTFRYTAAQQRPDDNGFIIVVPTFGDAAAGANFIPTHGTLTIPAGQTSATIPLSLTNDSRREPTYSVDVTLSATNGATLPNNRPSASARVTVTDDDPPFLLLAAAPAVTLIHPEISLLQSNLATSAPATYTAGGAITGGTLTFNPGPITGAGSTLWVPPSYTGGSLTLTSAGTPTGVQGATLTVINTGLSTTGNGTFTLGGSVTGSTVLTGNGTLILSPGTSLTLPATTSPDTIRARLLSAFSAGAWTGPGISSPAASNDPDHRTAVAYAVQPDGSTLVKPALYGDANLDGTVDAADRALIQQSLADPATSPSWSAGDFNYDNQINADDLTLLDRNLGRSL